MQSLSRRSAMYQRIVFHRIVLLSALTLLATGCGEPAAPQSQPQTSPSARDAVALQGNAEKALEVLEGYWLGQVRLVKDDDTQETQFEFAQRVTNLGQVYQHMLGVPTSENETMPVHELSCLQFNSGAIEDPTHWAFREDAVLVFDELPAEASKQAWESFQAGEEYDIAPDCWMRRKYLVHEVDDDRLLLMQPRRMAGWIGTEYYQELGIKGVIVDLRRITEQQWQNLLHDRHDPHYD